MHSPEHALRFDKPLTKRAEKPYSDHRANALDEDFNEEPTDKGGSRSKEVQESRTRRSSKRMSIGDAVQSDGAARLHYVWRPPHLQLWNWRRAPQR